MNRKKILRVLGVILIAGLLLQTAVMAYTSIFGSGSTADNPVDTRNVVIAENIQNRIREQDPANFERNINNYRRMLVLLEVDDKFKSAIEALIIKGKRLPDILISFEFLNECYGKLDELEILVNERESGKTWVQVFSAYYGDNPEFEPRSFDFDYLDALMKEGNLTSDDIMIADRVSQKSGLPFEEVVSIKKSGKAWKEINAELDILNAQNAMPRVPVTPEQIKKYTSGGALTEQKVIETLVVAFKLGITEEDAINKAKSGYTKEKFLAEALTQRYD